MSITNEDATDSPITGNNTLKNFDRLRHVFITGTYRSGTTLLHHLLDGHPRLMAFPTENCIFRDYLYYHLFPHPKARKLKSLTKFLKAKKVDGILTIVLKNEKLGLPLNEFIDLKGSTGKQALRTNFDQVIFCKSFEKYIHDLTQRSGTITIKDFFIAYNAAYFGSIGIDSIEQEEFFVNKCPEKGHCIHYYLDNFPGSKVLHIIRDPRACLASHKGKLSKKEFLPYSIFFKLISIAIDSMNNYMDFAEGDRVHCLRYEELVSNPANVMREVAEFLDIPFNECLLKPTILGDPWEANTSYEPGNKHDAPIINSSNMERWKEKLNDLEIQCIEALSGNEMLKLGYPLVHENLSTEVLRAEYFLMSLKSRAKSKMKRMFVPAARCGL